MYLHAGNSKNIRLKEIVGIFDMDTATISPDTKAFLKRADQAGEISLLREELPKSFILTEKNEVFFSQISTASLSGRIE